MGRALPRWLHLKHGRYYLVREGRWLALSRDRHDALIEYARLTAQPAHGPLAELLERALADMKKSVAASTHKNYRSAANRVREAFAEFRPEQVRPHHVARFLDDACDTPSMANLLRSFLRGVFVRAVRWGIVESDPTRDIKPFRTAKRDRYISAEEYLAIRAQATPTLACLMDLAYLTGQRLGDVMKLRYADITEAGVFVRQQKTGARVLIAMTPDLEAAIAEARAIHQSVKGLTLLHRRDGRPLAYGTIHHQWLQACEAAGVQDAHFHDLRAAAATDAQAQGLDSRTLLGHTTESSHRRYLRSKLVPVAKPVKARKS